MLMADLSDRFDNLSEAELADGVITGLEALADHIGADRVSLLELGDESGRDVVIESHHEPRADLGRLDAVATTGWLVRQLKRGRAHIFKTIDNMPAVAARDRSLLRSQSVESVIAVSLKGDGLSRLALLCEAQSARPAWSDDTLRRVRLIGNIIVGAVLRCRSRSMIAELSGRLVDAREQERRRIARELHDDVNQRMAHVCMDLVHLKGQMEGGVHTLRDDTEQLVDRVRSLSSDIGRVCRDLYPSKLEHVDFIPSLRGLCRDVSKRHDLTVHVNNRLGGFRPCRDNAFALYRVAQEALHNVVKHSGAAEVFLDVGAALRGVEMSIRDTGAGFDPAEAAGSGLGLSSMRDRLLQLGGHLRIETGRGQGTRLKAWVPATALTEQ